MPFRRQIAADLRFNYLPKCERFAYYKLSKNACNELYLPFGPSFLLLCMRRSRTECDMRTIEIFGPIVLGIPKLDIAFND